MSRRWTLTLLCVMLAITIISVSGEDHASLSNDDVTAAAVAAATGGAAASASTSAVQDALQSQPVKSDESAPHVQAVNVAKQYNDKYDEDEDQDDDFFLIPPPPKPTQVTPPKEHKSIDERIAAQKFKIQQLQEQLSAQREKHAAAATLIAKRNKEIEKRMRKHAAEMTKAADIQRRRDALDRAEKAEKARKAAAKRAAEIQAQQQVYALQKLLAQQSEAATLAERTLARQQQEDAIRKRVIATQHETYQQLEAELRAHEAEFGKHHHRHHHHHRLRQLQHRIQYMPFRTHPRHHRGHHHGHRHGRLSRRVTFTPRLSSNPFLRITPNPSWIPRRRLLGIRLRRWIIIQSIRARRAVLPPTTVPTITIARLQYQQARATARATLRAIVTRRVVQKRAALAAFRKFSQQIAITVTLARSALIHHKSHHHRHHGHHHRRHGHHHRYGRYHGHHHRYGRHHGYGHGHDAYGVHYRPLYRRHHHGRHHGHHHGYHHSRHHHTPSASSPFQFQLVKNPYPTIVSTKELAPQQVAPHSGKHVSHSAVLAA